MADSLLSSNNMQVNGGEFSIVQGHVIHNTGNLRIEDSRGETERIGRQKLFNNIYRNAFHNSSERSKEVNPEAVRKLVQKWTQRLRISLASAPTSSSPSFSSTASSSAARPDNPDDVIRDVFTWLFDRWTPFLVMWIHGESVTQSALIAQAIAGILQGLGKLSGSFFCSNADDGKEAVDVTRVIPTLAYQLMQNIQSTRFPIAQVVLQDESIFDLELQVQIERLLLNPLTSASGSSSPEAPAAPGIPNVFLIHNLERLSNKHHFHASFLHEFADALPSMESHNSLHRLLIIGQHTSHLRQCVSTSAMRQIVLQRPMLTRLWLGNVQEISRKDETIRQKEDALRRKEEELVSIRQQITQMAVSVVTQQVNEEIKTVLNKCVETLTTSMTSRIPSLQETIDEQISEARAVENTTTDYQESGAVDGADRFGDEHADYVPEWPDIKDAKWIWTKEAEKSDPPLPIARPFRRVIKTDSVVDRLMIDIVCDNRYTLYVNGRLVGCGADWTTPDRYGVEFQRTKKVTIAVYASEDEGSSPVGLMVSGKVWYSQTRDGKETAFISDGSWKTLSGDGFDRNFIWSDFKDSQWEDPYVIGCYGRFPWFLESMKQTQPGKLVHQRWTDVKFLRGNIPDAPEAPRAKLIS